MHGLCGDSWRGSLPKGRLLGLKVVQIDQPRMNNYYNHVSLFEIDFDGTVTEFWNISLSPSDTFYSDNSFTVDVENELVYLGSSDQFLAVDLKTGAVKIKIHLEPPNLQYFWNYDFVAKEKAIYGVCTGNNQWNWCRIKQRGNDSAHVEFLYPMPFTGTFGPIDDIYYIDVEEKTIWYYPSYLDEFAVGVNYTNAEGVFISAVNPGDTEDLCIVHDRVLDRVFTYVWNKTNFTAVGVGELFLRPKHRKILIDLSKYGDLSPTNFGTCTYDQSTHTMMGLMRLMLNQDSLMPTHLLLVDVISVTYKLIPLPVFHEKWNSNIWPVTSVKYLPYI